MTGQRVRGTRAVLVAAAVAALALAAIPAAAGPTDASAAPLTGPDATVSPAHCGPGSQPEHGVQGEVPLADRNSGRSQLGYSCNLVKVGQSQGVGSGWQNDWYDHCDYYDTAQNTVAPGVQVLDVSQPDQPKPTTTLTTPAMLGPWESLKVNQPRGLLGGVAAYDGGGAGPVFFDVYDVKSDCGHPALLSSTPMNIPIGHEGNWAPDGKTYYGTFDAAGTVAAIDVSDPTAPKLLTVFRSAIGPVDLNHGLSLSADGKTMYAANIGGVTPGSNNGLAIYDVSQIQNRAPAPTVSLIGHVYWTDGGVAQSTIPISYHGDPYVLFFDEGGGTCCGTGSPGLAAVRGVPAGAARLIDVTTPGAPKTVSVLRLAIQSPKYAERNQAEVAGNGNFGYEAHYCSVDREVDPTAAACGYFQSGIRVFDIRDPLRPHEIAYYNPGAQVTKHDKLPGSEHASGFSNPLGLGVGQPPNLTTDWCTSQIRFTHAPDGSSLLWAQCQDNGFMTLKLTNGVYPLTASPAEAVAVKGTGAANRTTAAEAPARSARAGAEDLPATGLPTKLPMFAAAFLLLAALLPRLRLRLRGAVGRR